MRLPLFTRESGPPFTLETWRAGPRDLSVLDELYKNTGRLKTRHRHHFFDALLVLSVVQSMYEQSVVHMCDQYITVARNSGEMSLCPPQHASLGLLETGFEANTWWEAFKGT